MVTVDIVQLSIAFIAVASLFYKLGRDSGNKKN